MIAGDAIVSAYIQETRAMEVRTPLGENQLLLQSFSGREAISSLFEFNLDLLSANHNVSFDAIVGKRVTVSLVQRDGSERFINGVVRSFSQSGFTSRFSRYQATVVPWLWTLTRTANCRIFQQMSAPDIIAKIFRERGFNDFSLRLHGSFPQRDYCVQYRESDFHFVSRLMEDEGICYFFEHTEDRHVLVLTNNPSEFKPCPFQPKARLDFTDGGYLLEEDIVSSWSTGQQVRSGRYETRDFNFEQPSLDLTASTTGQDERRLEVYDYPGDYFTRDRGESRAGVRIQEQDSGIIASAGAGNCRAFSAGYRFDLEGHSRRDQNRAYTITAVNHRASHGAGYTSGMGDSSEGFTYRNTFECIPYGTAYRPPRTTLAPTIEGTQTAIVTGPAGEEIYTDKYGRVKVQFHWDREGKRDQNSSCWIRVSQPWAGKGWGAVSIPRIGQEVVVDFLEGNPDRPIITGRVYNAEQMPPYALPSGGNMMGFKSDSTPGGGGYNEIVICDGKAGEEVRIHAQKNYNTKVLNNETHVVRNHRYTEIKHGDTYVNKEGDRTTTIEKGGDSLTINLGGHSTSVPNGEYKIDAKTTIINSTEKVTLVCGASSITLEPGKITISSPEVQVLGTPVKINC